MQQSFMPDEPQEPRKRKSKKAKNVSVWAKSKKTRPFFDRKWWRFGRYASVEVAESVVEQQSRKWMGDYYRFHIGAEPPEKETP